MKNAILASLLLLGISNAFGITAEKDGVLVKYNKYPKYRSRMQIRVKMFGLSHYMRITNTTNQPIVVDQSIISAPLVPYQNIARALRTERLLFGAFFTLGAAILGPMYFALSKDAQIVRVHPSQGKIIVRTSPSPFEALVSKGSGITAGASGLLGSYLLYKLTTETQKILEAKLEKRVLHSPITIQPGQSIEKIFWLKNPKDHIKIDFDAIKVLKWSPAVT